MKGMASVIIGIMDVNIGRQKKNIVINHGLLEKTFRPKNLNSRLCVISLVSFWILRLLKGEIFQRISYTV